MIKHTTEKNEIELQNIENNKDGLQSKEIKNENDSLLKKSDDKTNYLTNQITILMQQESKLKLFMKEHRKGILIGGGTFLVVGGAITAVGLVAQGATNNLQFTYSLSNNGTSSEFCFINPKSDDCDLRGFRFNADNVVLDTTSLSGGLWQRDTTVSKSGNTYSFDYFILPQVDRDPICPIISKGTTCLYFNYEKINPVNSTSINNVSILDCDNGNTESVQAATSGNIIPGSSSFFSSEMSNLIFKEAKQAILFALSMKAMNSNFLTNVMRSYKCDEGTIYHANIVLKTLLAGALSIYYLDMLPNVLVGMFLIKILESCGVDKDKSHRFGFLLGLGTNLFTDGMALTVGKGIIGFGANKAIEKVSPCVSGVIENGIDATLKGVEKVSPYVSEVVETGLNATLKGIEKVSPYVPDIIEKGINATVNLVGNFGKIGFQFFQPEKKLSALKLEPIFSQEKKLVKAPVFTV